MFNDGYQFTILWQIDSQESVENARHLLDTAVGIRATETQLGAYNVYVSLLQECHCMLFLTEDNDFAGKDQSISIEEVKDALNTAY